MSRTFDPYSIAHDTIRALSPYTPGFQPKGEGWVKLNTNESPYPPSPRVAAAVEAEIDRLRLYPDPRSSRLRELVAARIGCGADQVIIGNGSDDILNLLVRVFGGPGHLTGYTVPGYSLYPILIAMAGGQAEVVEFDRSMSLPVEAIAGSGSGLFFLTSPNAPTGVSFPVAGIESILRAFPGVLAVDEAYADFAEETAAGLLVDHPNLVIVRTLSKSHGLAGLRVGYAVGSTEVIGLLDRVRDSYNVSRIAQAAAAASLEDEAYLRASVSRIRKTRETCRGIYESFGWFVYPSSTNFLFVEPRDAGGRTGPAVAESLYDHLVSGRILVRRFPSHALTAGFLRFSVGADSEMRVLNNAVESWLRNE
ncbi:MAG: histidinol-phosphate transaminase [Opitutaceae bacterium]